VPTTTTSPRAFKLELAIEPCLTLRGGFRELAPLRLYAFS
jgi:hypothetical protein